MELVYLFCSILLFSTTLLIRLQILTLILFGIMIYYAIKKGWKAMGRMILAYLVAVALVVGIPSGIAKKVIPEAEGYEQMMIEEVRGWIS